MESKGNESRFMLFALAAIVVISLGVAGCGPATKTMIRWDWQPYDANEYKQEKDGVIVENKALKEIPSSLFASLFAEIPRTRNDGQVESGLLGPNTSPVMTCLAQEEQWWSQASITNNTDHVIRLNQVVIRLFDPAGNQFEPVSRDDLIALYLTKYAVYTGAPAASNRFKIVKFLDRNVEIIPKTTVTGWLAFVPSSMEIPGTWKMAIYEVPVVVDEAGKPTRTTNFDIRMNAKKFVDTYTKGKLVDSKEATE